MQQEDQAQPAKPERLEEQEQPTRHFAVLSLQVEALVAHQQKLAVVVVVVAQDHLMELAAPVEQRQVLALEVEAEADLEELVAHLHSMAVAVVEVYLPVAHLHPMAAVGVAVVQAQAGFVDRALVGLEAGLLAGKEDLAGQVTPRFLVLAGQMPMVYWR